MARALRLLRLNARATFVVAQLEENAIYTDYSSWLPDPSPTQKWVDCWSRLFPAAPVGCLSGLPATCLPCYEASGGDPAPPPAVGPAPL